MALSNFNHYCSPHGSVLYSTHFFENLTFSGAVGHQFPDIATPGSISKYVFEYDVPTTIDSIAVNTGEILPALVDVLKISREMLAMYKAGKRSVAIGMVIHGDEIYQVYHFSKVSRTHGIEEQHYLMFY